VIKGEMAKNDDAVVDTMVDLGIIDFAKLVAV
jgi:hypothetical protein